MVRAFHVPPTVLYSRVTWLLVGGDMEPLTTAVPPTLKVEGEAEMEIALEVLRGWAGVTVNVTVVEWVWPPPVPVIVRV